jgi:hypothetical protein
VADDDVSLTLTWALAPENAVLFADDIVAIASAVDHIELDYSVESLVRADDIVESFRTSGRQYTDVGAAVISIGFYLGEVLVRTTGARWVSSAQVENQDFAGFPVILEWPGTSRLASPVVRALQRFSDGPVASLPAYYEQKSAA